MKVRIFSDSYITNFDFVPLSNSYTVFQGDKEICDIATTSFVSIRNENGSIMIKTGEKEYGPFTSIQIKKSGFINSFKIRISEGYKREAKFDDGLIVNTSGKALILINHIELDYYVAGVVEAEGGMRAPSEYYKVQSILCRTYAISHLYRHKADGYQMCDKVHCQVFNGKCKNSNILMASIATKGITIKDASGNLVLASYYSNCGGQTSNAEDVWTIKSPCLKSVKDTFCIHKLNARWEKEIPLKDWKKYLANNKCSVSTDTSNGKNSYYFAQPTRKVYYDNGNCKIHLKNIRNDFKLKSTFFSMEQKGDMLVLKGRGFGHGVGLCQEGAMRMADLGYTYEEIIKFYYTNVKLSYTALPDLK